MKAAREPRSSGVQLCNFLFVNPPLSTEGKVARAVFRRAAAAAAEAAGLLRAETPRAGRNAATAGVFTLSLNICYLRKGPARSFPFGKGIYGAHVAREGAR